MLFTCVQFVGFSQNNFIGNQAIVMLNGHYTIEEVVYTLNQKNASNVTLNRTLSTRAHIFLLEFDSNQISVPEIVTLLKADERVVLAQPNHNDIKPRNTTPNDLEYSSQWSLNNSSIARIYAPQAWDISTDGITSTGDTIVLAVVDGGVDINHIDLNMFKNKHEIPFNGFDDDNNGYIDDYDGWNAYSQDGNVNSDSHGTHVAGIMGAKTNNAEGIAGIVWGAKILPVCASSGVESVVIEGYGYVLELRSKYNETNGDSGAFVVATNSSFGVDFAQPADYPIWCAFYDSLGAAGVLNMAATTNGSYDVDVIGDVPTTCPSNYMIAVSNINSSGQLLGGYGAVEIDLAAPGTNIKSTIPGHNYGNKTGTSMATPHVAGVVGAMYSAMCSFDMATVYSNPDSMALWVANQLVQSVDTSSSLQGKNNTNGKLNMLQALQAVQNNHCMVYEKQVAMDSCGLCAGQVLVSVLGDFPPYSVSFSDTTLAQGDSLFLGLCADQYIVEITDSTGFVLTDTFLLDGNSPMNISHVVNPASDQASADGSLVASISGGTPNYTYLWSTGSTDSNLTNTLNGTYSITVTDNYGCMKSDTFYLYTVGINETFNSQTIQIIPNPNQGQFQIKLENVNKPVNLKIFDVSGKLVYLKEVGIITNSYTIETNLRSGLYFLQVNDLGFKKIVIQ